MSEQFPVKHEHESTPESAEALLPKAEQSEKLKVDSEKNTQEEIEKARYETLQANAETTQNNPLDRLRDAENAPAEPPIAP